MHSLSSEFRSRFFPHQRITSILAALMLVVIIFWITLMWPVSHLGFATDPRTQQIIDVTPDGPAARAGIEVGDRIIMLYGQPYMKVLNSLSFANFLGLNARVVPIEVDRGGRLLDAALEQDPPSTSFQTAKLAMSGLALTCWITGYLLGVVRHHQVPESALVPAFWLIMGGMVSSLFFASYVSLPLYVGLLWLLLVAFVPFTVHIHLWFPQRAEPATATRNKVSLYVLGASLVINAGLGAGAALGRMSLFDQSELLQRLLVLATSVSLISSAWILAQAYRHATYTHTRRQIRLIGSACAAVGLIWILLQLVQTFVVGHGLVQSRWLVLIQGAIPLAYLAGGVVSDLYRVERVASRLLVHLVSTTLLMALFYVLATAFDVRGTSTIIWAAVGFVAFYRPVQHGLLRILPASIVSHYDYHPLEHAMGDIRRTLDVDAVIETLMRGVAEQFGRPAVAFYLGDISGTSELTLQSEHRMEGLPVRILPGMLTDALCRGMPVMEQRIVRQGVRQTPLTLDEERLLTHSACVLWCPVQHGQGHLLGLLLLGMRGDLDDYRERDQQKLEQLILTANFALANSASYRQLFEAEEVNRQLLQRLQMAEDATASNLARELHDNIINGFLSTNVDMLEQIGAQMTNPERRNKLSLVIESEQNAIEALRSISEGLYPSGLDDPFGLPQVLRLQVEKCQARFRRGTCELQTLGTPCPIAAGTQHEARRIAGEALTNAVKHANAGSITVYIKYPEISDERIQVIIQDDGRKAGRVNPQGRLGIHGMRLGARAVGGDLSIQSKAGVGTTVIFAFNADTSYPFQSD